MHKNNEETIPFALKAMIVVACVIAIAGTVIVCINAATSVAKSASTQTHTIIYGDTSVAATTYVPDNTEHAYMNSYDAARVSTPDTIECVTNISTSDDEEDDTIYISPEETPLDTMRETGHIRLMPNDDYFVNDTYKYVETYISNKYFDMTFIPGNGFWKADELGYLRDQSGYALCTGPYDMKGLIIETSAGPTRVIDSTRKVAYGTKEDHYTVLQMFVNW